MGLVVIALLAAIEYQREERDLEQLTAGETFANVNGARIRYRLLPSPAAKTPLVVFLTGMTAGIEQWEETQPLVATFAPTLVYDRAGTGFSRGSTAHDVTEQSTELVQLLSALHYDGPLVLVAFSLSATLAKVVVDRHPKLVKGIVLLEPNLPELHKYDPHNVPLYRDMARSLLSTNLQTFVGLRRWIVNRAAAGKKLTMAERRVNAALVSFQHWKAVTEEWLVTYKNERASLAAKIPKGMPLYVLGGHSYDVRLGGEKARQNLFEALLSRSQKSDYIHLDEPQHNMLLGSKSVRRDLLKAIQRAIAEAGFSPAPSAPVQAPAQQ